MRTRETDILRGSEKKLLFTLAHTYTSVTSHNIRAHHKFFSSLTSQLLCICVRTCVLCIFYTFLGRVEPNNFRDTPASVSFVSFLVFFFFVLFF